MRQVKELVNIMFFLPLSFGTVCYVELITGKDLASGAFHEVDGQVHSFVGISQLPLTLSFVLTQWTQEHISMVVGMKFMN